MAHGDSNSVEPAAMCEGTEMAHGDSMGSPCAMGLTTVDDAADLTDEAVKEAAEVEGLGRGGVMALGAHDTCPWLRLWFFRAVL